MTGNELTRGSNEGRKFRQDVSTHGLSWSWRVMHLLCCYAYALGHVKFLKRTGHAKAYMTPLPLSSFARSHLMSVANTFFTENAVPEVRFMRFEVTAPSHW